MERLHDDELDEYEGLGEHAHDVPQDGEKRPPPVSNDPEELPAKKQPPAHKGFDAATKPSTHGDVDAPGAADVGVDRDVPGPHEGIDHEPDTKIWDEASQRYMEGVAKDRKQATEADYHDTPKPGSGVTRGDASAD